jgi:hypothetical protein
MTKFKSDRRIAPGFARRILVLGTVVLALALTISGQSGGKDPEAAPFIDDLKGISIGMSGDEVKKVIGKPDVSDASGMYFDLDNDEAVQIRLDADKKVAAVVVIYSGKEAEAPKIAEVFGPEVSVTPAENGNVYKLVRYPSKGFWIAYSRIKSKDNPLTTITMNELN